MTPFIRKPVGFGGVNEPPDVITVQSYLCLSGAVAPIAVDGIAGPKTIEAIRTFQARFMLAPDGRVDPGGRTIHELGQTARGREKTSAQSTPRDPYWDGDSSKWSEAKKLESLNSEFRDKIGAMLEELRLQQFRPKIFYAWRSVEVQEELFRKKRSKVRFSFHNAQKSDGSPHAYAVDVIDRRWAWGAGARAHGYWDALGDAAHYLGLYWGGDWVSFKDLAHVQFLQNSELRRIKRDSGLA
ncbi:MAG: peptidoglycan-binding protein [Desulfosarcina sp.]|nr:peptidoglycan-binding protein [Desulfosarcina sp.]MBC2742409.1 peptidoglycan-binding protein [Desulfosarcina sp.]MBC2765319.1 peptidoglycan-binding protein [Desulfosarcina sp.]